MSTDQPNAHPVGPFLSSGEVAARLRVSGHAVVGWADRGMPHTRTVGGHLRIPESWLDELPAGPYLTGEEVAQIFRVSRQAVGKWADRGRMVAFKTPGGHLRVPESWVKEQLSTVGDPQPTTPAP